MPSGGWTWACKTCTSNTETDKLLADYERLPSHSCTPVKFPSIAICALIFQDPSKVVEDEYMSFKHCDSNILQSQYKNVFEKTSDNLQFNACDDDDNDARSLIQCPGDTLERNHTDGGGRTNPCGRGGNGGLRGGGDHTSSFCE